jgi:hypothetical protein
MSVARRLAWGGVALLLLAGCARDLKLPEAKLDPSVSAPAKYGSREPAPPPASGTQPLPGAPPAERPATPPVPDLYAWTTTPTLESVPNIPLTGKVNGREFQVAAVFFQPGPKGWDLILADKPVEPTRVDITDCQYLVIELPKDGPGKGSKLSHAMDYGGGVWRLIDPQEPTNWTSWNADNAWTLEITDWSVHPPEAKEAGGGHKAAPLATVVGHAKGRLALCYRAKKGTAFRDSWVAGHFDDALVRQLPTAETASVEDRAPF